MSIFLWWRGRGLISSNNVLFLNDNYFVFQTRTNGVTEIGVAIAKTVWFDIIPSGKNYIKLKDRKIKNIEYAIQCEYILISGLLLCWFLGQCLNGFTRIRSSSSRETASKLIGAFLILFHTVHLASIIVYVVAKSQSVTTQVGVLHFIYFIHTFTWSSKVFSA